MAIFENFKIVFMKNIIYDNDSSCSKRTKHDEEDEGRKDERKRKRLKLAKVIIIIINNI